MKVEGTVKWYNEAKGYGFLTREGGDDVFVNLINIVGEGYRTLEEGQRVRYEIDKGPKGLEARNVVKIS